MSTTEDLILYYQNLLIIQYYNKPKAIGTIGAFTSQAIADAIYSQVRDGFDLSTAVGVQLDYLGLLRGASRYFFTLDLNKTFMAVPSYDDGGIGSYYGLADYDDVSQPPFQFFMRYEDFISSTLQDDDFRRVIKFLAKVHSCDYSLQAIDNICYEFFGVNVNLVDQMNMSMKYQHLTSDVDILFTAIKQMGKLPHPAGVLMTTEEVPSF